MGFPYLFLPFAFLLFQPEADPPIIVAEPTAFFHFITLSARYSTDCGIVRPGINHLQAT
jgi:hypothetical protein